MAKTVAAQTTIEAAKFLRALNTAYPSLMFKGFLPMFSHFCFDQNSKGEGTVTAYNDTVGVVLGLDTGIVGGIPGDLLVGWLGSLASDAVVSIAPAANSVTFTAGSAVLKAPLMQKEDFVHKEPVVKGADFTVDERFRKCMSSCLVCTPDEDDATKVGGVILAIGPKVILYATNGVALARAVATTKPATVPKTDVREVLPSTFCRIVGKVLDDVKVDTAKGQLGSDFVAVTAQGEFHVKIWSKLLDAKAFGQLDYEAEVKGALTDTKDEDWFEAPGDLVLALKRIGALFNAGEKGLQAVELQRTGKAMVVTTKAVYGGTAPIHVRDDVSLPKSGKNLQVGVDNFALMRILVEGQKMIITDNLIGIRDGQGLTYLQSHLGA